MRVVLLENAEQVSLRAADLICQCVRNTVEPVLGLATGSTPLGTYQELVKRHQAGLICFSTTTTFNLDEYVGLAEDHPQSYHSFMRKNLFEPANFQMEKCHLPEGAAADSRRACVEYEEQLRNAGKLDLQLLGIGADGHIAFNEPGSSLASRTRLKALTAQTRQDNSRFFDSIDDVPRMAITMGIGTILEAKHIVLLATGAGKASAVRSFIEGPITAQVPASALQLHPHVTVLLDAAAASWLVRREYYQHVEAIQAELDALQPKA